jgi:ABC-type uncharacterized transport system substrate-binding protein
MAGRLDREIAMVEAKKRRRLFARWALSAAALATFVPAPAHADAARAQQRAYRILHVMSYFSPMGWADDQFAGFQKAMKGVPVEYRVIQMEANRPRSPDWARQKGEEARRMIEDWKPDLVYATDDDAQEHVTRHYANRTALPFVASGVNKNPAVYGILGAPNVAGVLEPVHIVETLRLLQAVAPGAKRFAVVTDESPSMLTLAAQVKEKIGALGAEVVVTDVVRTFEDYQRAVQRYQTTVDAFWPLGVHGFTDAKGERVSRETVLRWTAENSKLPDVAFWLDRVELGTLAAVTVSGSEQGLAAGRMARGILLEGKSPASYGFQPDVKGVPMISLARANRLGLKLKSSVLLSAQVLEKFKWENK